MRSVLANWPGGLGKVARLTGVDYRHRQPHRRQGCSHRYLQPASSFEYNLRGLQYPRAVDQVVDRRPPMPDPVHRCLSVPPKYAVSHVVGYLKGKSAILSAQRFGGRERNFTGEVFWARGYFVPTVGLDEAMVSAYIRQQEQADEGYDQMKLGGV